MNRQSAPTRRIARKLIFYLISASALITLLITLFQLYIDYERDLDSIDKRFKQIEKVNLDLISLALWETDNYELNLQLQGMHHLPDMQYLAISENGKVIISAGKKKSTNIIAKTYPILFKHRGITQIIGNLEVVATLDNVYQRLINKVWIIFISNAIKTFIIAGFLLFIFQRLVTRHINDLAQQVEKADIGNLTIPIVLKRGKTDPDKRDEFDVLINAFDVMRNKISESLEHIRRREEHLRLYENIMATTTDLMSYIDLKYCHRAVNEAYLEFYVRTQEEILGQHVSEVTGETYFEHHVKSNLDKTFSGLHISYITTTINSKGAEIDVEVNYYPYYGGTVSVQGAVVNVRDITQRLQAEKDKLRNIQVYQALAQHSAIRFSHFLLSSLKLLQDVFQARMAFVGRLQPGGRMIKTECMLDGTTVLDSVIYDLSGTPCELVYKNRGSFTYDNVATHFPEDHFLVEQSIESYFGVPLIDTNNNIIGILSVLDTMPHQREEWHHDTLNVFAARIAIEMERSDALEKLEHYNDELEKQVYARTNDLQESIKELESFSYSVSHDLRTPLRAINGFTQILLEDNINDLDETGVSHLNKIHNASMKMGELIDSLLKLSRITRQTLEYTDINLSQLAYEHLNTYPSDDINKLTIYVEDDVHCDCDFDLIMIALGNLLDNAIKYSSKEDKPKIEVGSIVKDDELIYFVRDNGVGFDQRSAHKLFTPFQRFHAESDFHGMGIGLATVERIVNRHGGKVWAESRPNDGATFYFTIGEQKSSAVA